MSGAICGTPVREVHRKEWRTAWCFTCRRTTRHDHVITAPIGPSYYEPTPHVECAVCHTHDGDIFPGWTREWTAHE